MINKPLTIVDRAILDEILELILADFPCENAEDKFGRQIEENLEAQGIKINFNDWIGSFSPFASP